jgi:hypothetical protein
MVQDGSPSQGWKTFFRNHAPAIVAIAGRSGFIVAMTICAVFVLAGLVMVLSGSLYNGPPKSQGTTPVASQAAPAKPLPAPASATTKYAEDKNRKDGCTKLVAVAATSDLSAVECSSSSVAALLSRMKGDPMVCIASVGITYNQNRGRPERASLPQDVLKTISTACLMVQTGADERMVRDYLNK